MFVLGLGGRAWSGSAEDALLEGSSRDLEIFRQGYPRALFFRMPEVEARRGVLSYEEWEKKFLSLDGIVGIENGVIFANPSTRPHTFDLGELFPDASFRRLQGSEGQDPQTNDRQPLDEELTLDTKDGLFVVRIDE